MKRLWNCWISWLLDSHGSTIPLGLFRGALILLIWSRLAADLAIWNATEWWQALFSLAFFLSTAAAFVGFHTKLAMGLLSGLMVVLYFSFGLQLGQVAWTHHHIYLLMICTCLTALGPCEKSLTLDRLLAVNRGEEWIQLGSLTSNRLILLQLAAIYFWTAIDKTNPVFLSGIRLEQVLVFHYADTAFAGLLTWAPIIAMASIVVVLVEYLLAYLVLSRKHPFFTLTIAVILHGLFFILLPVQTFSLTMLAMYVFIFSADKTSHAFQRFVGDDSPPPKLGNSVAN